MIEEKWKKRRGRGIRATSAMYTRLRKLQQAGLNFDFERGVQAIRIGIGYQREVGLGNSGTEDLFVQQFCSRMGVTAIVNTLAITMLSNNRNSIRKHCNVYKGSGNQVWWVW